MTKRTPPKKSRTQEKPQKAVALNYGGRDAPRLVAKGQHKTAQQIIALAKANNVHIHQDPALVEVLSQLELGDEIPRELYLAVAKIIAFAWFLQGKAPDGYADHSAANQCSPSDEEDWARQSSKVYTDRISQAQLSLAALNSKPALPPADKEADAGENQRHE